MHFIWRPTMYKAPCIHCQCKCASALQWHFRYFYDYFITYILKVRIASIFISKTLNCCFPSSNRRASEILQHRIRKERCQSDVDPENFRIAPTKFTIPVILLYNIIKGYLYNFDPLKPLLYIVKLGIIFHTSAQKHRLWVLVRTTSARRL